jgi:hypothetical protein
MEPQIQNVLSSSIVAIDALMATTEISHLITEILQSQSTGIEPKLQEAPIRLAPLLPPHPPRYTSSLDPDYTSAPLLLCPYEWP